MADAPQTDHGIPTFTEQRRDSGYDGIDAKRRESSTNGEAWWRVEMDEIDEIDEIEEPHDECKVVWMDV